MEKTKYKYLEQSDQFKGLPQPPIELTFIKGKKIIDLPDPKTLKHNLLDVCKAINQRRSVRTFSDEKISLSELSHLLWYTQGVKQPPKSDSFRISSFRYDLRTVPSAGARHCFETYILVNKVEKLTPGLYRFLAVKHQLQEMDLRADISENITQACLNQHFVRTSAVTFIWTTVAYRMTWRYGERGYRYMHLDAGHVCQNLYLSGEAINCGVCALAAFDDDLLNKILGLDGIEQFVIYIGVVGKK
ncbi:SagB/ThcOx family dehydrogenase [Candidatus Bathyarchaeota archaeon]|nr:SagB/ThcOx family dehydrogenase [Candidatus Bathyarchaeota archaeon]